MDISRSKLASNAAVKLEALNGSSTPSMCCGSGFTGRIGWPSRYFAVFTTRPLKSLTEFTTSPEVREELPSSPVMENAGFTLPNKRRIVDDLTGNGLIQLATLLLEFLPQFYYQTNNEMGDEVPFEDASAGQQATALLNVLLNQEGFPLVIDQPEDDIDNRAIEKIIHNFWHSKKKRQIIISSHNANLVVNGDSELVVSCDYNETSKQTKGHIKFQGSIDDSEIRSEITSIMEGGERAFKLRKEKYGF
jgi:chromosome segregation protein